MAATNGVKQTPGKPAKAPRTLIMPPLPPAEPDTAATEDFDAFWSDFRTEVTGRTEHILGVDVVVPTDVPLYFEDIRNRLADSEAESDSDEASELYKEMLALLFGDDTYNQWKANGATGLQLRVLTVWGMRNAQGSPTTFREAGEVVKQALADEAAGKLPGPNRASRREAAKKAGSSRTRASTSTGRRSSRTSGANTGSRRTT